MTGEGVGSRNRVFCKNPVSYVSPVRLPGDSVEAWLAADLKRTIADGLVELQKSLSINNCAIAPQPTRGRAIAPEKKDSCCTIPTQFRQNLEKPGNVSFAACFLLQPGESAPSSSQA